MRIGYFGAAALFAACNATAFAEPRPPLIPVSSFAALPILDKPLLSPDGKTIAARSAANRKTALEIFDADRPEKLQRRIELSSYDLASVAWAGNRRLLLTIESDVLFQGITIPFLRLIAVDVDTGILCALDQGSTGFYTGDVLYTDPSGAWALVASQ